MRTLTIALLCAALAAVAHAQEDANKAQTSATELLKSLQQVRGEFLGADKHYMAMMGIPCGEMRVRIEKSNYGIEACYRVEVVKINRIGDMEFTEHSSAYVTPGLKLVWGSSNEVNGHRAKDESTIVRDGDDYIDLGRRDDDKPLERTTFKDHERLIHGYTSELVLLALARAKAGDYEFVVWSELLQKYVPRHYTVKHDVDLDGRKATHIHMYGEYAKERDDSLDRHTRRYDYWFADGKQIRSQDHHEGMATSETEIPLARKPISREAIEKMDTPLHAALALLLAGERQDEKLAMRVMDMREFTMRQLKEAGVWDQIDPDTFEAIVERARTDLINRLVLGEDGDDPETSRRINKALATIMFYEGIMVDYRTEDGDVFIGPAKDTPAALRNAMGWFEVLKQPNETWRIVNIHGEAPRKLAEEKKDGEGKEEEKPKEPPKEKEDEF